MSARVGQPLAEEDALELFHAVGAVVLWADPDRAFAARILDPRAAVRLGITAARDLSGPGFWSAVIAPQELPELEAALKAVAEDGVTRSVEHRVVTSTGGDLWFRTSVRRAKSEARALLCVMIDVTTSRYNERQWREVEAWLVTLGEALPFDFWICDLEGRCVLQNPVSVRHLGNVVGRRLQDGALPAGSAEHWDRCFTEARVGRYVREELAYHVDGSERSFVRVVAPVRGSDGSDDVLGVLGVDLDVTDLKRTANSLHDSLVELRTAQEALVRRSQLAALGEMAAVVAHEVRNPLGAISNVLALLRRRAQLKPDDAALCRIIVDEVNRLDRLVAHLLDFVRPVSVVMEPTLITAVVDDALSQALQVDGAEGSITVVRALGDALVPVPMDRRLVGVAVTNVIRNAVQAMSGVGELHVSIGREQRADAEWAYVSIRDTGPGIPREVKGRMFDPFVTTRPTGSGLGLTIVKKVIEQHRGELDVQSAPGEGTTCIIRLPITRASS